MPSIKIDVIATGKLTERFWREACAEYLKRLHPYAHIQVKEVDDVSLQHAGTIEQVLELEAARIRAALAPLTYTVALERQGSECSSEQIASLIREQLTGSIHHVSFIIGGSFGLLPALRSSVERCVSFGPITLPHNLARVVLLEQLYRAFKIIRNEPYHK